MAARVLIVDDDVDLLDTLVRLLGRLGYKCRTASSGADAIMDMEAEAPDLVVTDLHMPRTDGLVVARYAREHHPPIPVILMTAYPTGETYQEVRRMGGTGYVTKPFANAHFVEAVERALGRHPHSCPQRC